MDLKEVEAAEAVSPAPAPKAHSRVRLGVRETRATSLGPQALEAEESVPARLVPVRERSQRAAPRQRTPPDPRSRRRGTPRVHGKHQQQRNVNSVNDDANSTLSAGPSASQAGSQASTMPTQPAMPKQPSGVRTVTDQPRVLVVRQDAQVTSGNDQADALTFWDQPGWHELPEAKVFVVHGKLNQVEPRHAWSGERFVFTSHYLRVKEGGMEADGAPQEMEASPEPPCTLRGQPGLGRDEVRTSKRMADRPTAKQR